MLALLVANLKTKYDYMFSSIQKLNTRANTAHLRDNWEVVGEDESRVYVIFNLINSSSENISGGVRW
jgi:hypothetical protein